MQAKQKTFTMANCQSKGFFWVMILDNGNFIAS